jgi:hypothetical protein
MYACILETGRGFFEGVCPPSTTTAHLSDPPLPLDSRIDSGSHALAVRRSGFTQDERCGLRGTPLPRTRSNTSQNALLRMCLIDDRDASELSA